MKRASFAVIAMAVGIGGCAPKSSEAPTSAAMATSVLQGAWQLERVDVGEPVTQQKFHDDMLVFSRGHYLNSQLWRDTLKVNTHGGSYRVSNDTLYHHVVLANLEGNKTPPDRASTFRIDGDTLRLATDGPSGHASWVYRRLD